MDLKLDNHMASGWIQGVYYGISSDVTISDLPTPWMSVKWHDCIMRTWSLPPRSDPQDQPLKITHNRKA